MKKRKHTRKDIEGAASLFFEVRGIVRQRLAKGKQLDPFSWLRIETMKYIHDHDKPPMHEISRYLSISAPSATTLIRSLVRDKLVRRGVDRRDRRSVRLRLTPKGRSLLSKIFSQGLSIFAELFSPLSRAELKMFARLLERLREGDQ